MPEIAMPFVNTNVLRVSRSLGLNRTVDWPLDDAAEIRADFHNRTFTSGKHIVNKSRQVIQIPRLVWDAVDTVHEDIERALVGGVVHSQLSVPSAIAHVSEEHRNKSHIANYNDLARAIEIVRPRVWSIRLNDSIAKLVYLAVVKKAQELYEDPIKQANVVLGVLGSQINERGVPPQVNTVWKATAAMRRVEMVVTADLWVKLGVKRKLITQASLIEDGFDLIQLAVALKFLQEVKQHKANTIFVVARDHPLAGHGNDFLTRVLRKCYGWDLISDPESKPELERRLKAVQERLLNYRKGAEARAAKKV